MKIAKSISAQLIASFGVILLIATIVGGVGFFGARDIAGNVRDTAANALPKLRETSELEMQALRLETQLVSYLGGALADFSMDLQIAEAMGKIEDNVPGTGSLAEEFRTLQVSVAATLESHRAASVMAFERDGAVLTVPGFLREVKLANAAYLKSVGEAASFGVFDQVQMDPAQSDFAIWAKTYKAPDPALQDLIDSYAEEEGELITYVAEKLAANPERAQAQFVRMSARRLPGLERALNALIEGADAVFAARTDIKKQRLTEMRAELATFVGHVVEEQHLALEQMQGSIARAESRAGQVVMLVSVVLAAGIGLSVLLAMRTIRRIRRPLNDLTGTIETLANEKYDIAVPHTARQDELGRIALSMEAFRNKLSASELANVKRELERAEQAIIVDQLQKGIQRMAEGDLTCRLEDAFPDAYEELRRDFNATVDSLNDILGTLVSSADQVRNRAGEISDSAEKLSERTENQAATLEQAAAALDQMTASVRSSAESAKSANDEVTETRREVEQSSGVVTEAIGAMQSIKESSDRIVQIVAFIDDIAFQTNLLALNAGVEAARAGAAGRGFSVVASEVLALAQRTSDAANEIKGLIMTAADQVDSGVGLVNRTGRSLSQIVDRVSRVAEQVQSIAASSRQQSTGLAEINTGVTHLDSVTQKNAAMVNETTSATSSMRHDADQLRHLVDRFQLAGSSGEALFQSAGPVDDWDTLMEEAGLTLDDLAA